jgi:hypothetical protein
MFNLDTTTTNLNNNEKIDIILNIGLRLSFSILLIILFYIEAYAVSAFLAVGWASINIGISIRRSIQLYRNIPVDKP